MGWFRPSGVPGSKREARPGGRRSSARCWPGTTARAWARASQHAGVKHAGDFAAARAARVERAATNTQGERARASPACRRKQRVKAGHPGQCNPCRVATPRDDPAPRRFGGRGRWAIRSSGRGAFRDRKACRRSVRPAARDTRQRGGSCASGRAGAAPRARYRARGIRLRQGTPRGHDRGCAWFGTDAHGTGPPAVGPGIAGHRIARSVTGA